MKTFIQSNFTYRLAILLSIIIFLVIAAGSSLTNRPQVDDGMFASPALNLAREGFFGTTVLEMEHSPLTRIDQRTYWVMPLFLLKSALHLKSSALAFSRCVWFRF